MHCPQELQLNNFSLDYSNPSVFYTPRFLGRYGFMTWRFIVCITHIVLMVLIWTYHEHTAEARLKLFIYYAYWSYLLLVLSTVVDLILVIYCDAYLRPTEERKILLRSESEETTTPWYMKLWWTVMNLAYPSTFISTILFWAFIHPHRPASSVDAWVVIVHLEGCLYIIVNMVFSRIPVRIYHTWQIVSLNVVYGFFTCFYYIAGGTNEYGQREIYYFIQWKNRKEMMLNASLALFVSALVGQLIIFAIYRFYKMFDTCQFVTTFKKLPEKIRENIPMEKLKSSKE